MDAHLPAGSHSGATSWKPMEKVTDCDRPGNDLPRHHRHGKIQRSNNAKNVRVTNLTKKLKLMYL